MVNTVNKILFKIAGYLSHPPGFYVTLALMITGTILIPLTGIDIITYLLSVAAIVITGIVLIEGDRNTQALHAKLDELILKSDARNELVGMEKKAPEEIKAAVDAIELEASPD